MNAFRNVTLVLVATAVLGLVLMRAVIAQRPQAKGPQGAQPTTKAVGARDEDVKAIQALDSAFTKAYEARDAKALGALFTENAEIEDDSGEVTRGRAAITDRFAGVFEAGGGGKLKIIPEPVRFLSRDLALEEGVAEVTPPAGGTPDSNRFSVIYAKTDKGWLHARIRDEDPATMPAHERLKELEWMLGEWVNESDDAVVYTTCKWSKDGNFLLRDFDLKVEGRVALSGTQRVGWDPLQKQFRTWVFDTEGGFGEGVMSRDGQRWVVKASGVRSDGQPASATNIITMLGKDRIGWQTTDRTIAGVVVPAIDEFVIVRKPPEPGK